MDYDYDELMCISAKLLAEQAAAGELSDDTLRRIGHLSRFCKCLASAAPNGGKQWSLASPPLPPAKPGRAASLFGRRRPAHVSARTTRHVLHDDDEVAQRGTSARTSIMSQSEKVLRYDLTATDGSGRRLVQYALPGSDFETAESLEADGLIEREFTNGEWTTTRVFAPDDIRVAVWQFNVNEQDRVHGRPLHFPNVKKRWFYFDESTVTVGRA